MKKFVNKKIERPSQEWIDRFASLDVSTVYEAQGKIGLMHHRLRPIQQDRFICGPAVTATCYAGDNLMIHAAIEVCQPGDVLVVSTIGESVAGMIGELIVRSLMKRGVVGLVIDAGIRDVSRIRELGFPVWTKAVHSQGTTKLRGGWVNAETTCGEVKVGAGDMVLADDDGVVIVKKNDLEMAWEASQQRLQREERTKERIERGELSVDFYGLREVLAKEGVVTD